MPELKAAHNTPARYCGRDSRGPSGDTSVFGLARREGKGAHNIVDVITHNPSEPAQIKDGDPVHDLQQLYQPRERRRPLRAQHVAELGQNRDVDEQLPRENLDV